MSNENYDSKQRGFLFWVKGDKFKLDDGQVWDTSTPAFIGGLDKANKAVVINELARQGIHTSSRIDRNGDLSVYADTNRGGFFAAIRNLFKGGSES